MPMHDWTRVDAGLYHAFHQSWGVSLQNALNAGLLPAGHFALVEQHAGRAVADVLTLERDAEDDEDDGEELTGGTAVAVAPPRSRHTQKWETDLYAARASRIAVRHRHGDVVAVIELVSPGNKAGKHAFETFVRKSAELIQAGVHLLVVDPFPPGPRDPHGVHSAVWAEFDADDPYPLPAGQPLAASAFDAGERVAYVEPFAVGQPVPELPLFLRPGRYVPCPLEAAYQETWQVFPAALKRLLGPGG